MFKFTCFISFICVLNSFFSQTFTGGSAAILDNQTVDISIPVSGLIPSTIDTTTFGLEQVCLNLTHTWDSDLEIILLAPDGTSARLISGIGNDGDDMQNTCFSWDASTSITNGTAPFSGSFKPMGPMGLVNNGQNPNGTWILRVIDHYTGDEGALTDWSITFGNNPASYFSITASNLPIVIINTNGQAIYDEPKIAADMGIIYNGEGVRNHITDPKNNYNGKIGIEIRGNYSAGLPQTPYAIELQDVSGVQIDASILGMPSEHDWLLIANYNDKSFARNSVPFQLFDSMGHYTTRNKLVDVILNGQYQGVYLFCEKVKRDSNRVDIAKLTTTDLTGRDVTGGYILKFDYWDDNNSWLLQNNTYGYPGYEVHMVYYYPKAQDLMPEQKTYIQNYINDFETALLGPNFDNPALGYEKYIDVPSFIDYFIISELTKNIDGYKKSRFFSKDKDLIDGTISKLKAGPVWDFDWSQKDYSQNGIIGGFMYSDLEGQDVNAPGWYTRLLEDSLFSNRLRCRYDDLRRTILTDNYIDQKLDSIAGVVDESKDWHFQTWGTENQYFFTSSNTYAEEIAWMKTWYHDRLTWLDQNLPGTLNGCSMTGIEENMAQREISTYPNPFTSFINIHLKAENAENCMILLKDQSGRIIVQKEMSAKDLATGHIQLNELESLQHGIYFLEIGLGNSKLVKKMVK